MADCDEKMRKMAEDSAKRQAKYYEKKRDEILARKRERYALKVGKVSIEPKPIAEPSKTKMGKIKTLTVSQAINLFSDIEKEATKKTYVSALNGFIALTQCEDLVACLKKPDDVLKAIEASDYSVNSKKKMIQMIVYMIDKYKLSITKKVLDKYRLALDESKIKSDEHTKVIAETNPSIPFADYIKKVEDAFGKDSKMYVIAKLYEELPMRDDFGLIVVNQPPTDKTQNYINVKPLHMRIYINQYKTKDKYDEVERSLSYKLSKIIRQYIARESVPLGKYLFGTEKLSQYVRTENKKIGVNGGISEFRHMAVTDNKDATPKAKAELAQKMKHSVATQVKYVK